MSEYIKTVKKQHVAAAATFAVDYIPHTDEKTLQRFLELVNVTGNFGSVSEDELAEKMRLFIKHIPGSCQKSLKVLADLLEMNAVDSTISAAPAHPRLTVTPEPSGFIFGRQPAAAHATRH